MVKGGFEQANELDVLFIITVINVVSSVQAVRPEPRAGQVIFIK
jgi:hypothetical protein